MRGSQREENFQKTSFKATKISWFQPPSFFIFQTCFQYSLTVMLFLPHVCSFRMGNFLLTSMDWEFYTMEMKLDTDVLEETFAL